jgi:hypothetical protein
MQLIGYSVFALWIGVTLILFLWDGYLSLQMYNYRIPKKRPFFGRRKFSFQTDPADYTEIGQIYRRKSIRMEIAFLTWVFGTLVVVIVISALFYQ